VENRKVALVGFGREERARLQRVLEGLSGRVVDDPEDCPVVVAAGASSSARFLTAVAMVAKVWPKARAVVSPRWVEACRAARTWLHTGPYLLHDEARFGFDLGPALAPTKYTGGVFKGRSFAYRGTPGADGGAGRLSREDAGRIIRAGGGTLEDGDGGRGAKGADYVLDVREGAVVRGERGAGGVVTVEWLRDSILRGQVQPL
jgi:hypothetical protein